MSTVAQGNAIAPLRRLIDRVFPRGALAALDPVARLLRAGHRSQPGLRQHLRRGRRARRLQRGLPHPRDRPRRPRRRRADGAVRADLHGLRARRRRAPANDFGRTVLTGAVVAVMASPRRDLRRRAVAGDVDRPQASTRPRRTCTSSSCGSTASPRSCSRRRSRSARSSSPTGGSCSTRSRRSSTRPGSSSGTVLVREPASGSSRRPGARSPAPPPISAIRAIGTPRTTFRIRPGVRGPDRGVPRVLPPDDARGWSQSPIEPLTFTYFTRVAAGLGGRQRHRAQLRARLPGPAGQPDRRLVLAGRLPASSRRPTPMAIGRRSAALLGRNLRDHRGPHDARRHRPVRAGGDARPRSCSAAARFGPEDVATHVRASSRRSPCRSRSMPCPIRCHAGCTRPTTRSARSSASFAGFGVVVAASTTS